MTETLLATNKPKGVGLAAPQIGEPYQVFITRPSATSRIEVFINPKILKVVNAKPQSDNKDDKLEGCLSIPKIWGKVNRSKNVVLSYQDLKGAIHKREFKGFPATIVQHETDHLQGILFTRRVLEEKGKLYEAVEKDGKETLEEISL